MCNVVCGVCVCVCACVRVVCVCGVCACVFVWGRGGHILIFFVSSVRLDSILLTEGSILEACYEFWE
jgi:hypothetical protein